MSCPIGIYSDRQPVLPFNLSLSVKSHFRHAQFFQKKLSSITFSPAGKKSWASGFGGQALIDVLDLCLCGSLREPRFIWLDHWPRCRRRPTVQCPSRVNHQLCTLVGVSRDHGVQIFELIDSSVYAVVAMLSGPVINLLGPRNAAAIGSLSYVSLLPSKCSID